MVECLRKLPSTQRETASASVTQRSEVGAEGLLGVASVHSSDRGRRAPDQGVFSRHAETPACRAWLLQRLCPAGGERAQQSPSLVSWAAKKPSAAGDRFRSPRPVVRAGRSGADARPQARVIRNALIGATGSGNAGLAWTLAAYASPRDGPGRDCGRFCDRAIVGYCQLAVAAIVHCPGLPDDGLAIATAGLGRGRLCEGAGGEQETSRRDCYSMHGHAFPPFSGRLQLARAERPTHRPPLQPAPRCPNCCVCR